MRRYCDLVAVVVLLATSCAKGTASEEGMQPAGSPMAGLTASCGGAVFDRLPPDTSSFTPFSSFGQLDLSHVGGEAPFFREFTSQYRWFVTQEGDGWRELWGEPSETSLDPPYADLRIEKHDGSWAPVGWGQCRIELAAEGWGNARFVVDPKSPPDPRSTEVTVLATENACANGGPPDGRTVRPVILDENDRSVSIVILVESGGGADCPSNPAFPFRVDLGAPLGDRQILDASVYPTIKQWPN